MELKALYLESFKNQMIKGKFLDNMETEFEILVLKRPFVFGMEGFLGGINKIPGKKKKHVFLGVLMAVTVPDEYFNASLVQ